MSGGSKPPQKPEDNSSKVKDKFSRFFGFGKPTTPLNVNKIISREVKVTPNILKEIGPESPANNRLKTIKQLCEVVLQKQLEDNAVEALWGQIKDLLHPSVIQENRHLALHFLQCLLEGQLPYMSIARAHFFRVVESLTLPGDLKPRLDLFATLSGEGKNLLDFEEETGAFLLGWMSDVMAAGYISCFLPIILNVIKYNAAYLDEDIISGLVQKTCMIPNRSRTDEELTLCLQVLDAVISYSYLPSDSLFHFVAALCHTVDKNVFCEKSWQLMRKLLGTYLGHSTIFTMCCMLQDKRQPVDTLLLRGAIFFTGMALWGSRKVSTLKHTHASVLPSFYQALEHGNNIVAYEVVLNVQRLVSKYGKDLQPMTWEIVMDILERLLMQIDKFNFEEKVVIETNKVISTIEELNKTRQFFGPTARFFHIVEMCANQRPFNSVFALIDYHTQFIHPGKDGWIEDLHKLLEKYLKCETRTEVREKALEVLSHTISINAHVYEKELIDQIILPHFSNIHLDSNPQVRRKAAELLLGLCEDCNSGEFFELTAIVEKIITKPLGCAPGEGEADESKNQYSENHLIDIDAAINKIIEIFKTKLYTAPASHCCRLYKMLVSHMEIHYTHTYLGATACQIRKNIFNLLVLLRADNKGRVGLADRKPGERHVYSPYTLCSKSEESLAMNIKSSELSGTQIYGVIEYEHTFKLFLTCLEQERNWIVLHIVLEKFPLILENKTLVLSADRGLIGALCAKLFAMVKDKSAQQSQKLINRPKDFKSSDMHSFIFPVLASMVTYHSYLEKPRLKELVSCLEFGLVSKCAKVCVTTLRICSLEMKDLMMRMLPSVLLSLSKISATISMAIPVLAFLSSIIRIPKLYANFVEDQYMSVFAIALPYTNPFKFSHYTVSLAHHVIGIWFIRCRLPFRKGFVKYIQKGLKCNVEQVFEENSVRHLTNCNQNSNDRGRSGSLNEGNKRRRHVSGIEGMRNTGHLPMDENMSQFHKELMETCVDMMSRYAFGNFTAFPKRTPIAEFLLKDGQQETWVMGNKIVTITTSGNSSKLNSFGLCDKCMEVYENLKGNRKPPQESSSPVSVPVREDRRRHKSMASLRRSRTTVDPESFPEGEESLLPRRSQDDMILHQEHRLGGSSQREASVQSSRSFNLKEQEQETSPGMAADNREEPPDRRFFFSTQCSCWCTGWAEVKIRGASGVISWMMRIENESSRYSINTDPLLPDITQLLAPVRCRTPDTESLGKIDSGSLCEEEYETLHSQHFSEAEKTLFQETSCEAKPAESVSDPIDSTPRGGDSEAGLPSLSPLRRISSSPSILSNSLVGFEISQPPAQSSPSSNVKRIDTEHSKPMLTAEDFSHTEMSTSGAELSSPKSKERSSGLSLQLSQDEEKKEEKASSATEHLLSSESSNKDDVFLSEDAISVSGTSSHSEICVSAARDINVPSSRVSDGQSQGKKAAHRSHSENIYERNRPDALNLKDNLNQNLNMQSEDIENLSSSMRDEVPELRQLKRRGHTISVMIPAADANQMEDLSSHLKTPATTKDGQEGLTPNFVFLQLYHCHPLIKSQEIPVHVPNTGEFHRTVARLDHIYPYETHKIGVMYMGKGQPSVEKVLLSNEYGSSRYTRFIQGLGQMISIEEAEKEKLYLGGLTLEDGKFAIAWHDESLRVIFHIATLMHCDQNINNKKRHIGNDFVTIVYNDSSESYQSGTITGQFNFVSIVIRPLDHESNAVSLITKEVDLKKHISSDIAEILGHTHTKIISDANLPLLVRQIAVHCNLASMVLQRQTSSIGTPEVFASNWLERLRKIKLLKRRVIEHLAEEKNTEPASPSHKWPPSRASGEVDVSSYEDFTDFV